MDALREMQRHEVLSISHAGQTFHAPRTIAQLAALRADLPKARILAGSTDVGLWVTKHMRDLGDIIYIGQVDALKSIKEKNGWLEIGAGVTLEKAYAAAHQHLSLIHI